MTITRLKDLSASQRRIIRAWCMYDWANSAFATSASAIFPVYSVLLFKEAFGEEASFIGLTITASSAWAFAVAISTTVVALTSPVLGIIADHVAIKKALLWAYTIGGSLFTALAFFSAYTSQPWAWMFGAFMLANIGFAGSLVFYNSLLPHVAPRELLDDVSSRGYAYGYFGGGVLLLVSAVLILLSQDTEIADLVTRFAIASVGVWWFGWALWTLKVVPEPVIPNPIHGLTPLKAVRLGFRKLGQTVREVRRFRVILGYLGAYLLFNDGVQTVLVIAGAFAADTLGIPLTFNLITILIIQFVAVPGAMMFARLARRLTTKGALTVALAGWCLIVFFGIAIAPLAPTEHGEFAYQLAYQEGAAAYVVESAPELEDSRSDTLWRQEVGSIEEGDALLATGAERLLESVRTSEIAVYSISILGGGLDGEQAVGHLHPSTLSAGPIDWWPVTARALLWEPLGLGAGFQWLFVGLFVGLVIGGSQALARSLFSQITPETRSGEFFSFFGFMSRASAVFGPLVYVSVTAAFDTRVAVTSIAIIILAGAIALRWVNVEAGSRVALAEDARLRGESR